MREREKGRPWKQSKGVEERKVGWGSGWDVTTEIDIVGARSTVVERGSAMRVDECSNPAQTEVASAVVRS